MKYFRRIPAIIILMSAAAGMFAGQITVASISVVSNARTRDFIITQELEFEKGKTYDQDIFEGLISNSVQNLKNLGIFGDVSITYKKASDDSSADIIVTAGDKWTFFPIPIYYYDTRIGSSVMISLIEGNLAGLNQSLEIDYNYEYIPNLEGIDFQYSYPRILGSYYNTKIAFSYESFIDSAYDMNQNVLYKSYYSSYSNYIRLDRKFFAGGSQWVVFIESGIQYETNVVVINNDSQAVQNGLSFYPGIGVEEGVVNYDLGTIWGNFYRARIDISPLSLGVQTELRADQYFRFWEKSGIAVRADFQSSSLDQILLTPDEIRGISLGQIRGNYLLYGNFEFRPYIFTLTWPAVMDFYIPLFIDAGDGILSGQNTQGEGSSASATAGLGIRFYPRDFGSADSCIRLDLGVILPYVLAGYSFNQYFYLAFNFQDEFD
ncbi:MAG: POTRA domain-containing protein [Brevinematales bacterium]